MRCLMLLLTVAHFNSPTLAADGPPVDPIPTQSERTQPASGYESFKAFPRLEVVKEGVGTADPALTALIPDPRLRARVEAGDFTSLQLLHLAIKPGGVESAGAVVSIPYVVSLKHTEGPPRWTNWDQGTIDLVGRLLVESDGSRLRVTVERFDDSYWLERWGRGLGYSQNVDLAFARLVVPAQLEHWFNADHGRIEALLERARRPPLDTRVPAPR